MDLQELYETIKSRDITELSKDLYYRIEQKGSANHRVIGSYRQHLLLYAFEARAVDLPCHIDYEEFRRRFPGEFGIHMTVLKKCSDAGFKI